MSAKSRVPTWTKRSGDAARAIAQRRRSSRLQLALFVFAAMMLAAPSARSADPLPIQPTAVVLDAAHPVRSFSVDLSLVPNRPVLVAEATADGFHADMPLEIEMLNWTSAETGFSVCPRPDQSDIRAGNGSVRFEFPLFNCYPLPIWWIGTTVEVRVRAVGFGSAGSPALVSVTIHADTRPATGTLTQQVETNLGSHLVMLTPSKDSVLYSETPTASNGAGSSLWAGRYQSGLTIGVRRALFAFDLSAAIPPVATVDAAKLTLGVVGVSGPGGEIRLFRGLGGVISGWDEGNAVGPGTQITGATSSFSAADWQYRSRPSYAWTTTGGDFDPTPLVSTIVTPPQVFSFVDLESEDLRAAVQDIVTTGADNDGFVLVGPNSPGALVQIASREGAVGQRPALNVTYTQNAIYESGAVQTGVVTFVDEGQNFRWIYDLDHDNVLVTDIGGVCEVVNPSPSNFLPYTYRYQGTPGYTGIDCCTWKIDAPQTGTVGTGQALFFHNLDASNPANMPPDTDLDGIRNLCDNCPSAPNGPLRGSCLAGAVGSFCRSNSECGAGGLCSLSQEDSNGDFAGDVCAPEPGFAASLVAGLAGVALLARRRSRSFPSRTR